MKIDFIKKIIPHIKSKRFIVGSFAFLFTALLLYAGGFASGPTTHYWTAGSHGNWSNASNWSTDSVPDFESPVVFNGDSVKNVNIDVPIDVASITVSNGYTGTITTTSNGPHLVSGSVEFSHNDSVSFGNGSWNIGGNLDFSDFSATADLLASTISVVGNVFFGGTINPAISTLILNAPDGVHQNLFNINGYTLNNLTKISTGESTLGFDDGETLTVSGVLNIEGGAINTPINLRPVSSLGVFTTNPFTLNITGTHILSNINIEYSTCTGVTVPCLSFGDNYIEATPFTTFGWLPARSPGGVSLNLAVWLRGDAGLFEGSGDLAEASDLINEWKDVSGNNNGVSSTGPASTPTRSLKDFNYNQSIDFDGSNDYLSGLDGFSTHSYYLVFQSDDAITDSDNVSNHGPLSWNISGAVNSVHGYTFTDASAGLIFGSTFNTLFGGKRITHTTGADNTCTSCSFAFSLNTYPVVKPIIISVIDIIPAYWFVDIFVNNLNVDAPNGAGWGIGLSTFTNRPYFVGAFNNNAGNPRYFYDGKISEVISYSLKNTVGERSRINSYLALKYGITLDQSGLGQDYVASDGVSVMWDNDIPNASTFDNNIAGIGRDDVSGLYQPRSRNQEPLNSNINNPEIDSFEISNPTDLDNLEFLTWGNSGVGYSSESFSVQQTEVPLGYTRLVREWKVQENGGDVGTVTVMTDAEYVAGYLDYAYMLVDDDGDFSDAIPVQMTFQDVDSGQWIVDYNFVGGEYVTFATKGIFYEFTSGNASSVESSENGSIFVLINGALRYDRFIVIQNQFTGNASVNDYTFNNALVEALPAGYYDGTLETAIEFNGITIFDDSFIESSETIDFLTIISGYTSYYDLDNDGQSRNIGIFSIIDDDSANVIVTPTQVSAVEGDSAVYTVSLTSEPDAGQSVVVVATPENNEIDLGFGAGFPIFITLTNANWDSGVVVTVTSVDDDEEEDAEVVNILHTIHPTLTTDTNYLPLVDLSTVVVLIPENDSAEISVSFVAGCTNPSASNYNPNATIDNGSCIISGCIDSTATNYNSSANIDDGSCSYQIPGCTNGSAINYNPNATVNNGSCIIPVPGCTNPSASNFNSQANTPDGSCIYLGCTDPGAENYDSGANSSNSSCIYSGCTDPNAYNYNPSATDDNDSCQYAGCLNPEADNYDPDADVDDNSCIFSTVTIEIPVNPVDPIGFLDDVGSPGFGSISRIITGIALAIALGFLTVGHLLYGPMTKMKIVTLFTRFGSGLLAFLGVRKKTWGIVYDSKTKQPLDPVYITLTDEEGKLISTSVTDIEGRYGFLTKPGIYKMYAHRSNYEFPSVLLAGQGDDEIYKDLYFGELLKIEKENEFIAKNIPMDPLAFDWNEFVKKRDHMIKTFSKQKVFMILFTKILFSLGFGLSILAVIVTPNIYNILILVAYFVVAFLEKRGLSSRPFGLLKDENDAPASFSVIHVFSGDTGLEISRKVADEFGRYVCFLPNGDYTISIDKRNEDGLYSRVITSSAVRVKKGYLAEDFSF